MDGRDGLQLLSGTKKRLGIKVPGENRFLYIGSAILGAVIVTSFWLNFSARNFKNELKSLDDQMVALDQKRNKQTEANVRLTQRQLALTSKFVERHLYFSQAILKLSSLIQEQVQIENLSLDLGGNFNFGGFAANYTVVARQVAAFLADDSVIDLTLGKMESQSDGTIKFAMEIQFDEVKLLQKAK